MRKEEFDPEVYEFYKAALEGPGFKADLSNIDIELMRENEIKGHAKHLEPYDIEKRDITVKRGDGSEMWLRVYVPETVDVEEPKGATKNATKNDEEAMPVILYFHGGGFIMGSIEEHDTLCGQMAEASGAVVVAPEYRLAPEHPFPACIEDAVFTAEWALEHSSEFGGDPDKMIVGGDSSGANISAALALLARDGKAPKISGLILFYGTYGCIDIEESASAKAYGQGGYVLPVNAIEKMMELYIPQGTDFEDYRLNSGKAKDLSGMPPSIIVSGELDPLRDDGEEFARRLEAAGNKVCAIRVDGMMHGFMKYRKKFSRAEAILEKIGKMAKDSFF